MSELYQGLKNEARAIGENNDCGVKALAVVTGLHYALCHATLKRHGRRDGKATFWLTMNNALNELGFSARPIRCDHKGLRSLGRDLPNKGQFIIFATRHYAGVKDGQIHDWSAGRCKRVQQVFQIDQIGAEMPLHSFEVKPATRTRATKNLYQLVNSDGEIIAKYKRFPAKIKRIIDANGIFVVDGVKVRAWSFQLQSI